MTTLIRWYDDTQRVLYLEVGPGWDWEAVYALCERAGQLRQTVRHPVGFLVHAPHTNEFPPGLSVTRMKRLLELDADERFLIIVGTSLFVQMMISSIMSLMGFDQRRRVHFASTLDEAAPILAAQLARLPAPAGAPPARDQARSA